VTVLGLENETSRLSLKCHYSPVKARENMCYRPRTGRTPRHVSGAGNG
jgi:hypothetical protein